MYNLKAIKQEVAEYGYDINTIGRYKLAKALGVSEKQARNILRAMKSETRLPEQEIGKKLVETVSYTKDGASYELPKTRIHTLEQLIEYFNVDTSIYEVERFICNKWEVGAKDADGKIIVEPLYQVKATFKHKDPKLISVEDQWKYIETTLSKPFPSYRDVCNRYASEEYLVEINMPDAHLGLLAHADETGDKHWDLKLAKQSYLDVYYGLMDRVTRFCDPEKILMIVGNDLMNADTRSGTTERGTMQDQDTRYFKMFQGTWDCVYETVTHAWGIAPVDVCIMPGNHDRLSTAHLGFALRCATLDWNDFNVDNRPLLRKYYEYGVNMLMFTHGDGLKHKDIPLLMMTEQPEMAGRTKFREAHLGHIHQEKVLEQCGVKVRVVPSLCPASYWASSNGWTTGKRGGQAFVYHKTEGLVAVFDKFID